MLKRAQELDEAGIKKWTKLAVQAKSLDELRQNLGI